jgi:Arc-like DNA binding dprotein
MPKSKEMTHLRVRVRPQLLARLKKASKDSGRTLTGEIVTRLEESFTREPAVADLASQVGDLREWLMKKYNPPLVSLRWPGSKKFGPVEENEEEDKK